MSFENVWANRSGTLKVLDLVNHFAAIKQYIDIVASIQDMITNEENPITDAEWLSYFSSGERDDLNAAITTLRTALADIATNQPDLYAMI